MCCLDKLHLCPGSNVALARYTPVCHWWPRGSSTARCDVTVSINLFNCLVSKFPACGTFGALYC